MTGWPLNTSETTTPEQYMKLLQDRMSHIVLTYHLEKDEDLFTYYVLQYVSLCYELPVKVREKCLRALDEFA